MTDDGRVGLGEASLARVASIINDEFAPKLKGLDPCEITTGRLACLREHRPRLCSTVTVGLNGSSGA